ncbi:MAG TPA: AAA family ATPase [Solirubrobacteraceae bacterium]|jgi:WD40 repeat protein|nr:AAA family ATPase [Solirubrobacteraceae bacterium]
MTAAATHLAAELRTFVEASRRPPADPYRSLEPFRFADASILAARDREIERLDRLITMYRGVLLYGETGVGKTSVVNAGVLPRLIEDGYWPHRVRVQPTPTPGLALEPIASSDGGDDAFLPSAFADATESGQLVVAAEDFVAAVSGAAQKGPIVLVFDQFEELVTLFPRMSHLSEGQEAIVEAIVTLLRGGPVSASGSGDYPSILPVKLLLSFREDYLAALKPLIERYPDLIHQGLRLVAPPQSCATEIIRAPFEKFPGHYPRELSPELAERIAALLAQRNEGEAIPLTELQIVCDRIWRADEPSALLVGRGISGLLEDHTEDALKRFPGPLREAAMAVLGQLITASNTRNVVAGPDLVERAVDEQGDLDPKTLEQAITRLEAESGLIRRERRHDLDLYELTSEFLIPWISRQRGEAKAARKAEQARREEEEKRRQHERRIRVRLALGVITVALAVVAVLAVVALHQRNAARHADMVATDLQLAQSALDIRPDASLVLALAAYRHSPGQQQVRSSLIAALEQAARSPATAILHGAANTVTSVAFDPRNGGILASGSADGTIRLWSAASRRQVGELRAPTGEAVFTLAFSPDGRTIVSGAQDGTIQLWSMAAGGGRPLGRRQLGQGLVVSVAFSPDGRVVAGAGLDAGIDLIGVTGGDRLGTPVALPGSNSARGLGFSADSRRLASVTSSRGAGAIQVWNVASRTLVGTSAVNSSLYTVAFDPARPGVLAAAGQSGQILLWDLAHPAPSVLGPQGNPINSIAFSGDGATLAVGKANDSIELWNLATKLPTGPLLTGHEGIITSVAFSPDGHTLASGSTDETIRLWPIPAREAFGQILSAASRAVISVAFDGRGDFAAGGGAGIRVWRGAIDGPRGPGVPFSPVTGLIKSVAFTPAGDMLASGSNDGTVRIWRAPGGTGERLLYRGPSVYRVAFSPDGRTLAIGGAGQAITLVDVASGAVKFTLPASRVFALAFSPDGAILASGGDFRTITLWSLATHKRLGQLTGNSDAVFSLAFSPQGGILASGSADDTVRLWSVVTRRELGPPLLGNHAYVRTVAFDPSGKIVASGTNDGMIRLWDVASETPRGQPLSQAGRGFESVAFSPDGRNLISGGLDHTVRGWPVINLRDYPSVRARVCSLVGTGLSRSEWSQFAPGAPYENPCR